MLLVAGILFGLALLLWFVDGWMDNASVDLAWPARALIVLSAMLVGLDLCM